MTTDKSTEARTFLVETRFQKLARRPGGVTRAEAIEHAQARIEEVRPSFSDWLDGELEGLAALIGRSANGSGNVGWIDDALAHARRIRDVGTTMGFPLLTFVADNLCDIFEAIKGGAECRHELLDCHIEALLLARQERYRSVRPEQVPELTGGLRRVAERAGVIPEPAAKARAASTVARRAPE